VLGFPSTEHFIFAFSYYSIYLVCSIHYMKKLTNLLLLAALLGSCSKDKTTTTNNNTNTPAPFPYYFNFTFDGVKYNLNTDNEQYMYFNENQVGGYQVGNTSFAYPAAGIRLSWPNGHKVTEAELMALVGKTISCADTNVNAEISFTKNDTDINWYSVRTFGTKGYVKIDKITTVRKDTLLGAPVTIYAISGNCSSTMYNYNSSDTKEFAGGEFNYRVTRRD